MIDRSVKCVVAAAASSVWIGGAAFAGGPVLFDFESEVPTQDTGAYNPLVMSDGDFTVSIGRTSGIGVDVFNDDDFGVPDAFPFDTWGNQVLSPFFDMFTDDFFVADFSESVIGVTIEAGDFGADSDTVVLEAYSGPGGTGLLIDSVSVFWDLRDMNAFGDGDDPVSLSVAGAGIESILFRGGNGGEFPNSMYFDNLSVVIPAPATFALLGLVGLVSRRRRRA